METVRLGRTNIVVNRNGFGALPVQRVNMEEAKPFRLKIGRASLNYSHDV